MNKSKIRREARVVWSRIFGPIRKGMHLHHILPLSEGGTNKLGNLIVLHPDDHALVHKMRGDVTCSSGFIRMKGIRPQTKERKVATSKRLLGNTYAKGSKGNVGNKMSEESKRKMSLAKKGLYDGCNHPQYGIPKSQETRDKIGAANSKLSEQKQLDVYERYRLGGVTQSELAAMFGVGRRSIRTAISKHKEQYNDT